MIGEAILALLSIGALSNSSSQSAKTSKQDLAEQRRQKEYERRRKMLEAEVKRKNEALKAFGAAADFHATVARSPTFAAGWNNLGIAQIRLGQYARALGSMQRALRQRTGSAAAWNNIGVAYLLNGRRVAARRAFTRAVRLRPGYGPAKRNLQLVDKRARGAGATARPRLVVAWR